MRLLTGRMKSIVVVTAMAAFLGAWAFLWEPSRLVITRAEISLPPPYSLSQPLKIALLADIHAGSPFITLKKLQTVVELTNQESPDLILLLGDFDITGVGGGIKMQPEPVAAVLSGLHAPLGVFSVLGNHDWWGDGDRVTQALQANGIPVLEEQAVLIQNKAEPFWLIGLGDLWTRHPDAKQAVAKITDDRPIFLFTHNPDIFPNVPPRVSMTFAGHTHGGQVNFPIFGRLVVPSRFGERYAAGHIVEGGRHLYVTTGIGTSILPVRFRVPPEIAIVTFHASRAKSD